jgi:uncharacterized membrane protein
MTENNKDLPDHIAESVGAVEDMRLKHREEASRFELLTERGAQLLGQPLFLAVLAFAVAGWLVWGAFASPRTYAEMSGLEWLDTVLTIFAVFATLLILTGQRRQERLGSHREQLTLQFALLNEQKSAKIIALLEEYRRDNPEMIDRTDPEAEAMSSKIDPKQVSAAIAEIEKD